MNKIISFSLWGNTPMYIQGAFENVKLAKEIYPSWKCRFYVDSTISTDVLQKLHDEGAEIFLIYGSNKWLGLFTRFYPAADDNVDVFISRDCDSRLSSREKRAVYDWLNSDKMFHCMHDHPYHYSVPILGGMWGCKKGVLSDIKDLIKNYPNFHRKGADQDFLKDVIWPKLDKNSIMHHDDRLSFPFSLKFPTDLTGIFPDQDLIKVSYVGEIFDEYNKPVIP